jgi:amino acid transporter
VLITLAGSVCCALSIGQFADRVPSAGSSYTYNSRGLGPAAGFLTGWMMIFAYALFVPAGIGLTSAFGSRLLASTLHVTIDGWLLIGAVAAGLLRARRPAVFQALGRRAAPDEASRPRMS